MTMKRRFYLILIGICLFGIAYVYGKYENLLGGDIRKSDSHQRISIQRIPLVLGAQMIFGFGTPTESPYAEMPYQIPKPKFYVTVAEPDRHCVIHICGLDGSLIKTIGGWVQVYNTKFAETVEFFELDSPKNHGAQTMVIISDENGKIVGIYPNKNFSDVISILKLHPNLANFDLLGGINEFGALRVGALTPIKPGDPISYLSGGLDNSVTHIPTDKKFYLYALQNKDFNGYSYLCFLNGCRYPEFAPDHNFLPSIVDYLDGWLLASDEGGRKIVKLFGLDPKNVLSGKSSLMVLTDARGVIRALHPQKTMSDALTILSQYPDLVDTQRLYQE